MYQIMNKEDQVFDFFDKNVQTLTKQWFWCYICRRANPHPVRYDRIRTCTLQLLTIRFYIINLFITWYNHIGTECIALFFFLFFFPVSFFLKKKKIANIRLFVSLKPKKNRCNYSFSFSFLIVKS
jgi:hypothetical protein